MLDKITELSHEFSTPEYIQGGGGNTSAKNQETLWIKPSGVTLAELTEDMFVAMDRRKLAKLFEAKMPAESSAREAAVMDLMMTAMYPYSSGRPSVEAPLHDTLDATFVVHTHPYIVNGMTCSRNAAEVCKRLFPEALWVEYVDPGYTLCSVVRGRIKDYIASHGCEPEMVIIENHGIFVASKTAGGVRKIYKTVMNSLRKEYKKEKVSTHLNVGVPPSSTLKEEIGKVLQKAIGKDAAAVCASGAFKVAGGPLTPDHVVFMKSYPFVGEPTVKALNAFKAQHGYFPKVISVKDGVFTVGPTEKNADLTMRFAKDGALVEQLANGLAGVNYMSETSRIFIENWEVEVYRQKVAMGKT